MRLLVTQTYNEQGAWDSKIIEEREVAPEEIPQALLELARRADDRQEEQKVVVTFPEDNTDTVKVEIYNGFRE